MTNVTMYRICLILLLDCLGGSMAAPINDLVYRVPKMERCTIRSNLQYKLVDSTPLTADLYRPADVDTNALLPAIIFVLGDASPATLRNAKDWQFLRSYGALASAQGWAGIVFNHRSSRDGSKAQEMHEDIVDVQRYIVSNASTLGINTNKVCMWFFSGSGPHLSAAWSTNVMNVNCIVAYYPALAPGPFAPKEQRPLYDVVEQVKGKGPVPPTLLAKAGRDDQRLNKLIDAYRAASDARSLPLTFLEHPTGRHAFDILDDDETSKSIIGKTIDFVQTHFSNEESRLYHSEGVVNDIYFERKGEGEVIVLLHGGQMDRRMWDDQFSILARDFQVIRYDLRGYGRSRPPNRPYSHAEDLRNLLKTLKVERAHLIGLSLGAAVSMEFALLHPERVTSLILAGPGLGGFQFTDAEANPWPSVVAAQNEDFAEASERWLKNPYMRPAMEHPELQEKLRVLTTDNSHCWLNNPLLKREFSPPAAERLKEISAPTLIIHGSRDVSDIGLIVEKLAKEIPGAEQRTVSDCGHIINMEKPAEFNQLVFTFLQKQVQTIHRFMLQAAPIK